MGVGWRLEVNKTGAEERGIRKKKLAEILFR